MVGFIFGFLGFLFVKWVGGNFGIVGLRGGVFVRFYIFMLEVEFGKVVREYRKSSCAGVYIGLCVFDV